MQQIIQHINIFSVTDLLMASVAVILIISLFSIKNQRKQQQYQLLSMQSLQSDLRALANAAVGVGGRVLEIERHQRKHPEMVVKHQPEAVVKLERQKTPVQTTSAQNTPAPPVEYYKSPSQPYEMAIRMAQTGSNTDEIVSICGLSQSEADLVSMMHRLDKVS